MSQIWSPVWARVRLGAAATILPFGLAAAAQANSVCVRCDGPDATYECRLPGEGGNQANRAVRTASRLACIQAIATTYKHRACSVRKNVQGPCIGDIVRLDELLAAAAAPTPGVVPPVDNGGVPGPGEPVAPAAPAILGAPPANPSETAKKPADDSKPPKTMTELAKRTGEATERQLQKTGDQISDAGNAVGSFMKKSWRCMTSLFSEC